jgi:hypothetical protein
MIWREIKTNCIELRSFVELEEEMLRDMAVKCCTCGL